MIRQSRKKETLIVSSCAVYIVTFYKYDNNSLVGHKTIYFLLTSLRCRCVELSAHRFEISTRFPNCKLA